MDIHKVALELTEFYDSVVIVATKYTQADGETVLESAKAGNHYACSKSVEDYVEGTSVEWIVMDGDDE